MKFRIFHGGKPVFNKKDFDTPNYECIAAFYTKKEQPVTLCRHKENNIWKVQYGFSTLMFDSYAKAMDYCKSRFYDKSGKKLSKRKDV